MIQEEKKKIRLLVKELKSKISVSEKRRESEHIFKFMEETLEFKQAKILVLYWSMPDEVQTHAFIEKWANIKTILLPVVNGAELDFKIYKGRDSLILGEQFNIAEPSGEIFTDLNAIDLIIVPGIAFDKNNNRMGRGRGYYDKFLSQNKATKIGVCFNCQLFDQVPTQKHDIKMNQVIYPFKNLRLIN